MVELPDAWSRVMNALLEAPVAWRTPAQLAVAIRLGDDEATDLLCDLELAGWLVVRDAEPGPLVTLSPLAAARLRIRLVEVGQGETPRWASDDERDPPVRRSAPPCAGNQAATLDRVVAQTPSPALAAERSERAEALARYPRAEVTRADRPDFLPRPGILIGLGLSPWPGPHAEPVDFCPACGGQTLPPRMYCLYCDRWGLDCLTGVDTPAGPPTAPRSLRPETRRRHDPDRSEPPSNPPPPPATDFTRPPRGTKPSPGRKTRGW